MRTHALLLAALAACQGTASLDVVPSDTDVASPDLAALQARLTAALADAPSGVDGMGLLVHDATGQRVIAVTVGDFGPDRRIAVASASKLVSGLVLLRLMEEGRLSMTDTPRTRLGWTTSPAADATLDHLGAFVSGLPGDAACTLLPGITLAACAEALSRLDTVGDPGERFEYGSTHLAVAAAMAEAATGESWAQLFQRTLAAPLGLTDPGLRYVTLPLRGQGETNPLVAGGLLATPDEYLRLLGLLFDRGSLNGTPWIAPERTARMERNDYTDATLGVSPMQTYGLDHRYSWTSWLLCDGPVATCPVVASPGAFGFTPWIDREHGYYAALAMQSDSPGAAEFSTRLARELMPGIVVALTP